MPRRRGVRKQGLDHHSVPPAALRQAEAGGLRASINLQPGDQRDESVCAGSGCGVSSAPQTCARTISAAASCTAVGQLHHQHAQAVQTPPHWPATGLHPRSCVVQRHAKCHHQYPFVAVPCASAASLGLAGAGRRLGVSVQPSHLDSRRSFDEGVHLFRRWTPCRRDQWRQGAGTQMS